MVFSSTIYLFVFLPVVLSVYYNPVIKGRTFKNIFLLFASLVFYAWGEPAFVFLMLLSILVTWFAGLKLQKTYSKIILISVIFYHIIILFIFKYLMFIVSQIGLLINKDTSAINISLPIGISFFTFQLISYLFDIYYKKADAQRNPFYVGLYVSLFPQLIAGPIVRYEKIAKSITNRSETYDDVVCGMQRFIYGLGKKVLISNYVAQIADNIFDYLAGNTSVLMAWLGAVCYTLQIYFDFSGYSDMAIGLGRMFGFSFDENFNYPYISKSITEFWRRWHISLSSWFRDYVYIPLGGNRVKKPRWILNLFVVWILTGIWHGANWTFLLWGLLYFVFLLLEKTSQFAKKFINTPFSYFYTILIVIITWVIFRADNIKKAVLYIGNMFGIGVTGFIDSEFIGYIKISIFILTVACIGCTPLLKNIFANFRKKGMEWIESVWLLLVFIISLLQVISSTYNPFIYFNF